MRTLFLLIGVGTLLYVALAAYIWRFQGRFLYFPETPSRQLLATPEDAGMPYTDVELTTVDGIELHGWFVPGDGEQTVLFFHGNAGNISHRLESIRLFNQMGASVLIIDYRGYGRSAGSPDEHGTYRDARASWDYLVGERGIPAEQITLFGRSLGGAVAAWLATEVEPRALILESTFTSVPDMAREVYPFLPASLARIRYDTLSRIASIRCPILLLHSPDDRIIPFAMSEKLSSAARDNATLITMRGGHNDAHLVSGEAYVNALRGFMSGSL